MTDSRKEWKGDMQPFQVGPFRFVRWETWHMDSDFYMSGLALSSVAALRAMKRRMDRFHRLTYGSETASETPPVST